MKTILVVLAAILFFSASSSDAANLRQILKDKVPVGAGICQSEGGLMKKGGKVVSKCVILMKQGDEDHFWTVFLDDKGNVVRIIKVDKRTGEQTVLFPESM